MFTRKYPARGIWEQTVESNDKGGVDVVDSFTDGLRSVREPKYMKCAECGKRVLNPSFEAPND